MRRLLIADFSSSAGSTMALLGVAFLCYDSSRSVVHTVMVSASYSLSMAVLGMFAGRFVQRVSRRRLLLYCYSAKVLLYSAMAAVAAAGLMKVPQLLVSAMLAGVLSAFISPAWMEYERDLIPASRLAEANGAFGAVSAAAGLAGALGGGALMGLVGVWSVFAVNVISYGPFLWILYRVRAPEHVVTRPERISFAQARAYIRSTPPLRKAFGRITLLSLLVAPISQLLPAVAAGVSPSKGVLGLLTAVFAAGAMGVARVIAALEKRFSDQSIIDLCMAATSAILVLFGVLGDPLDPPVLWVVIVLSLIPLGLLLSLGQSVIASVVQVQADPKQDGPVFALYSIVYTVVAPVGGLVLGWVADTHDVWTALRVAGLGMLAFTVVMAIAYRPTSLGAMPDTASNLRSGDHNLIRLHLHHLQAGLFPSLHHRGHDLADRG